MFADFDFMLLLFSQVILVSPADGAPNSGATHRSSLTRASLLPSPSGFAITPLVLAPFSESYGRHRMYTVSTFFWLLCTLGVALSTNTAMVIVFRFLAGCFASPGSTLVGGSIADLWLTFERDAAMSAFAISAFLGTGIGECVSGWIELDLGWRYIQYVQVALIGLECLALTFLTQETRGSYILSKRAARLREDTGDDRYQCRSDAERASVGTLIRQSLSRPIVFLTTEPIVTTLALWFGFAWGEYSTRAPLRYNHVPC